MSKHNSISILRGIFQVLEKEKVKGPEIRVNLSGPFINLSIKIRASKKDYTKVLEAYLQGHLEKNHIRYYRIIPVVKTLLVSLETV